MLTDFSRQKDLFLPDKFQFSVHVIGAGATGSWVTVMLAKLGVKNITVYDFDTVGEHNLANQLFRAHRYDVEFAGKKYSRNGVATESTDIDEPKVVALREIVYDFADIEIKPQNRKVEREKFNGIVFSLVDSMKARRDVFEANRMNPGCQLIIETRMGLDEGRCYTVNPCNRKHLTEYDKTLYGDDVAATSACGTSQSIGMNAAMVASMAVWQMVTWFKKEIEGKDDLVLANELFIYPTMGFQTMSKEW